MMSDDPPSPGKRPFPRPVSLAAAEHIPIKERERNRGKTREEEEETRPGHKSFVEKEMEAHRRGEG